MSAPETAPQVKSEPETTAQVPPAENAEISTSAMEGRRLYIGNLAYATSEGELKSFFTDFLVEAVSIPTNPRTNRPVGYAFVDLSTPTEAQRAISELNGQSILDRKVSIQLARKPEQHAEGATSGGEGASGKEHRRRGGFRGRGRGRGRGGRTARNGRGPRKDEENGEVVEGIDIANGEAYVQAPVFALRDITNIQLTNDKVEEGDKKTRPPRQRRQRGPPEDGIPSKTKIMVANLPYDLHEEKLMEIFKDYSPTHAKIALRPIPRFMVKKLQARGEARKGRGFGFVTLESEELQLKACSEMNGKEIDGREIAVKVAIDSPDKADDEELKSPTDTPAEGENAAPTIKTEPVVAAA